MGARIPDIFGRVMHLKLTEFRNSDISSAYTFRRHIPDIYDIFDIFEGVIHLKLMEFRNSDISSACSDKGKSRNQHAYTTSDTYIYVGRKAYSPQCIVFLN